jgi:hypothetical protein
VTSIIGALALGLVVLVVAVKWLMEGGRSNGRDREPEIDHEELSEAEREVRDLDSSVAPDDADEQLRDWGPGAPR